MGIFNFFNKTPSEEWVNLRISLKNSKKARAQRSLKNIINNVPKENNNLSSYENKKLEGFVNAFKHLLLLIKENKLEDASELCEKYETEIFPLLKKLNNQ